MFLKKCKELGPGAVPTLSTDLGLPAVTTAGTVDLLLGPVAEWYSPRTIPLHFIYFLNF